MEKEKERFKFNKERLRFSQKVLEISKREGEVLTLVAGNKTNIEIAKDLNLSIRTIENHRYRICKKLGLEGRGALEEWATKYSKFLSDQKE